VVMVYQPKKRQEPLDQLCQSLTLLELFLQSKRDTGLGKFALTAGLHTPC